MTWVGAAARIWQSTHDLHAGHSLPPGYQVHYGFDSNSTCSFAYQHSTAYDLRKDYSSYSTTSRKPITLITCTWTEPEDQCKGLQEAIK